MDCEWFGDCFVLYYAPGVQTALYKPDLVYAFTAVFSFILGYTVALVNSHLSVFAVKRIRTDYLARISGITTAAGAASMPVASFLVSIVVAYVDTSAIFITSGVLALIVTVCMFFPEHLDKGKLIRLQKM